MEKEEESFVDTIKTVIYAILIAVVIRSLWFEPFKIPSGSMYPTLYVGDYLFVSKYTYGYSRHSLPFSLPLFKGRIWSDNPQRGDVIVFKNPQDNSTDFIKRVIGLPKDKIKLEKGRLFINGKKLERKNKDDFIIRNHYGASEHYNRYIEVLPEGKEHYILEVSDNEPNDNFMEVEVPEGHYFMMGDNRDRSDDSRVNVGFVPLENMVGKARFLFYSHNDEGAWYLPWTWPKKIRWSRLFNIIN